jgi:choline dehydrogenase-like flavoprotein
MTIPIARDSTEVVVVGSGASGVALTWRLATAGVPVTCLERGHWQHPGQAAQSGEDWEARRLRDQSPNPNVRGWAADYPVLDDTTPIKPIMVNAVGGSTVMWSAHAPRFRPSDFRVRTLDGVGADWPLTYWDLAPYYELNDRIVGISGLAGDPGNPPRTPRTTPPVALGPGGARIAAAFDALGWHWWPPDGQILTADAPDGHAGRLGCNGCGPCELGCPRGARSSADITYWPRALAAGARLVTGATVMRIRTEATSGGLRATGVEWRDDAGRAYRTDADVVVLACNGVGTPRLLLAQDLANSSDQVGRNLMLHPIAAVTGVFDEALQSWAGNTAFALFSQEFYETDPARDFVRGYQTQLLRGHGPVVTALGGLALDIPWGQGHHARFEQLFGHVASLAVTCEDLPEPDNRVVLDKAATDRFGVPAARMVYRVSANSERMIDHGIDTSTRVLREAGAREVLHRRLLDQAGFHLMGTARMGADPGDSVVDARCRTHDVPNLMIVDGSVFASAAAVNPTPTIQAVALRAADLLLAERGAGSA